MAQVKINGEPIERALRRFKREIKKDGILVEMKKREYYEKPSEKRKRRMAQAKRKQKRAQQEDQWT